ncbi:hypothetical protein PRIPAC_81846 [Pristionchus pacificus]|uniref:Uncharacterized protein n=1 Tax=Pristionchus pacificus TaxID=54126 RepID=A0A2A6CC09_PRIPA|nr:hypothetical protein PRIPAC_81846 [Pristionchus pacificus]|eukprot:PDM75583.1 hypothetical protein PRIPAC_42760 [Pristionchus pacificus]
MKRNKLINQEPDFIGNDVKAGPCLNTRRQIVRRLEPPEEQTALDLSERSVSSMSDVNADSADDMSDGSIIENSREDEDEEESTHDRSIVFPDEAVMRDPMDQQRIRAERRAHHRRLRDEMGAIGRNDLIANANFDDEMMMNPNEHDINESFGPFGMEDDIDMRNPNEEVLNESLRGLFLEPEDGGGDEFDVSFDNTNENERFNNGQGMISETTVALLLSIVAMRYSVGAANAFWSAIRKAAYEEIRTGFIISPWVLCASLCQQDVKRLEDDKPSTIEKYELRYHGDETFAILRFINSLIAEESVRNVWRFNNRTIPCKFIEAAPRIDEFPQQNSFYVQIAISHQNDFLTLLFKKLCCRGDVQWSSNGRRGKVSWRSPAKCQDIARLINNCLLDGLTQQITNN